MSFIKTDNNKVRFFFLNKGCVQELEVHYFPFHKSVYHPHDFEAIFRTFTEHIA